MGEMIDAQAAGSAIERLGEVPQPAIVNHRLTFTTA
jgi:hypothetical protein